MKEADAKEIRIEGKFKIIVLCIEYMWWIDETGTEIVLFSGLNLNIDYQFVPENIFLEL